MSTTADALAIPKQVTHKGKTYDVAPHNVEIIAQFEAWVEEQAWAVLRRAERHCSPQQIQRLEAQLVQALAVGDYSYPREAYFKAMCSKAGLAKALQLSLNEKYPEVDEQLANEIVEAKFQEIQAAMLQSNASVDPTNGQAETV